MTTTAIVVSANNKQYHYDQGVYYEDANGGYKSVSAPIGAKIPDLPDDTQMEHDSQCSAAFRGRD